MDRPKDPTRLHHEDAHRPRGGVFFDYELTLDPFVHRLLGDLDEYEKRSRQASRILRTLGEPFWDQVSESRSRFARGNDSATNIDRNLITFSENLLEEKARFPDASSTIRKVGEALAGLIAAEAEVGMYYVNGRTYCVSPGAWHRTWLHRPTPGEPTVIFNRFDDIREPQCRTARLGDYAMLIQDAVSIESVRPDGAETRKSSIPIQHGEITNPEK